MKKKEDKSKISNEEVYCIYCGYDKTEKHAEQCPLIGGIPKGVYGFRPRPDDNEWNLHLGRMGILMTINKIDNKIKIGPLDEKIYHRLSYEFISFSVRRFNIKWLKNQKKSKIPVLGKYYKKKYIKEVTQLENAAKIHGLSDKEFNDILSEKVLLLNSSGKEMLPFFRNVQNSRSQSK